MPAPVAAAVASKGRLAFKLAGNAPKKNGKGWWAAVIVALVVVIMPGAGMIPVIATLVVVLDDEIEVETDPGELVDDYPEQWRSQLLNVANPTTGYYYRNCTDFVFWRVNRDMGVSQSDHVAGKFKVSGASLTPKGGDGKQWGLPGNMPGWTTVKDAKSIRVGDVVSISKVGVLGTGSPEHGHVGVVGAVDADTMTTENYGFAAGYFTVKADLAAVGSWINQGVVVVKHNPELSTGDLDRSSGVRAGPALAKQYAQMLVTDSEQYACLEKLWIRESGWRWNAENPSSGAYGIPQSLPGSKMAANGADWKTNAFTQIDWGVSYIKGRYKTPCGALRHSDRTGWY